MADVNKPKLGNGRSDTARFSSEGVRVSIASIIRGLLAAAALSGCLGALLLSLGFREIAVPFLLATTIELGLIVIAVTWRLLTNVTNAERPRRRCPFFQDPDV